ncbi:hypothetical protein MAR_031920, partial [Mya arenaria]
KQLNKEHPDSIGQAESVSIPQMTTSHGQGKPSSKKDEDDRSYIVIGLATSTGCLGAMLLLTLLSVCLLWKKMNASAIGPHSQANTVGGEHHEGLRGREQDLEYQHYAALSF